MATYLLDTSVIAISSPKATPWHALRSMWPKCYAGIRPQEESNTKTFLQTLELYPVTWPIAELAGIVKRDFSKRGTTLAITDILIAAVALHHQLHLITDNVKDFPAQEVSLYPLPN